MRQPAHPDRKFATFMLGRRQGVCWLCKSFLKERSSSLLLHLLHRRRGHGSARSAWSSWSECCAWPAPRTAGRWSAVTAPRGSRTAAYATRRCYRGKQRILGDCGRESEQGRREAERAGARRDEGRIKMMGPHRTHGTWHMCSRYLLAGGRGRDIYKNRGSQGGDIGDLKWTQKF